MKVRQPNFGHAIGVSILVPYSHEFVPTPNLSPTEIAYHKGREIAQRGRDHTECPYDAGEHPNLHEHWMRGYKDHAANKPDKA